MKIMAQMASTNSDNSCTSRAGVETLEKIEVDEVADQAAAEFIIPAAATRSRRNTLVFTGPLSRLCVCTLSRDFASMISNRPGVVHGKSSLSTVPTSNQEIPILCVGCVRLFKFNSGRLFFHKGNRETEGRSLPWLADYLDLAAMRGHDGARDRKAHPGAFAARRAFFAAIKFLKNKWKVGGINAGAVVLHCELEASVLPPACQSNTAPRRGVSRRVLHQVAEDAPQKMWIEPCWRVRRFDVDHHPVFCEDGVQFIDHVIQQHARELGDGVHLDYIGVDLRHFHGITDQFIQARTLLVDKSRQIAATGFIKTFGLHQRGGCGADGSQRGAQFVRE